MGHNLCQHGMTLGQPLIREAGDSCGDEVALAADVTRDGCGREDDDSLGPDVRARLEGRAFLTLLRGTGDGARGPIRVW